jgi:hypothetical protein
MSPFSGKGRQNSLGVRRVTSVQAEGMEGLGIGGRGDAAAAAAAAASQGMYGAQQRW